MFYGIAVLGVVGIFNAACWGFWRLLFEDAPLPFGFWVVNVMATAGLTVGGSLIELGRFDRDPDTAAHRLGARAVDPGHARLGWRERRLVNVVEEMSLAARLPVPRIFILERDASINALATGLGREDAAIIVTAGALDLLERDELQGVVSHEVAHIAAGDVAVSTRVAALNAGLELVSDAGRRLGAFGGILLICGLAGHLAATVIAAAMSRNRELRADALAVELTREPTGLGRALRKLWWLSTCSPIPSAQSSPRLAALATPTAAAFRTAMFDAPPSRTRWLHTHPPLAQRITRLLGYAAGPLPISERSPADGVGRSVSPGAAQPDDGNVVEGLATAAWLAEHALAPLEFRPVGRINGIRAVGDRVASRAPTDIDLGDTDVDVGHTEILAQVLRLTHDASDAAALSMLLAAGAGADESAWSPRWRTAAARQSKVAEQLRRIPPDVIEVLRWPLLERAAASLRLLAHPWPQELLATLRARIEMDQRVSLSEWVYYMLLRVRLLGPQNEASRGDEPEVDPAQAVRWVVMLLARSTARPELRAQRVANELLRVVGLSRTGQSIPPLDVGGLQAVVTSLRRLPMLRRPLLMRGLAEFLPVDAPMETRDFLRVLALIIDTPMPGFDQAGERPAEFTMARAIPAA